MPLIVNSNGIVTGSVTSNGKTQNYTLGQNGWEKAATTDIGSLGERDSRAIGSGDQGGHPNASPISQTGQSDDGFDSFLNTAGTAVIATGRYLGSYGAEIARSQSVRAALGIAAGTSLADGPVPVGELVGAGIVVSAAGAVVIDKAAKDIGRMIDSTRTWANRPGEVYTLRAARTGIYPNLRGGTVVLEAEDIWKIGQTINVSTRYPAGVYRSLGLTYNTEYVGGQLQILMTEKLRLAGYVTRHGHLPPGNRILR